MNKIRPVWYARYTIFSGKAPVHGRFHAYIRKEDFGIWEDNEKPLCGDSRMTCPNLYMGDLDSPASIFDCCRKCLKIVENRKDLIGFFKRDN